jgi:membrane protein YqaA with SNARE-associated domain
MSGTFAAIFRLFLTPLGLPILAALDSSVIFFFPFGLDLALVLMTARQTSLVWLYPLLATTGSVVGAAFTYWLGRKIGQHGIERFINARRLDQVKKRIGPAAAISSGFLALIPPPFPFTAFILAAGAFDVSFRRFILAFAVARLIRSAAVSGLAFLYGRQIVRWMESDTFEIAVSVFIAIAMIGTAYSAWRVIRATRTQHHAAAA